MSSAARRDRTDHTKPLMDRVVVAVRGIADERGWDVLGEYSGRGEPGWRPRYVELRVPGQDDVVALECFGIDDGSGKRLKLLTYTGCSRGYVRDGRVTPFDGVVFNRDMKPDSRDRVDQDRIRGVVEWAMDEGVAACL